MATKSKNDSSFLWSLIALGIAVISIAYCFSHAFELINEGAFRSSRAIAQLTRLFKGGV